MSSFFHFDPLPGIGFHTLFKPASVANYLNYQSTKMTVFATLQNLPKILILWFCISRIKEKSCFTVFILSHYSYTYIIQYFIYTMLQWGFILLSYIFTLYSNIQILQPYLYSTLYNKGCVLSTFLLGNRQ